MAAEGFGAMEESVWEEAVLRCPVTGGEARVHVHDLALVTGPGWVNWIAYDCPACGGRHRASSRLLNMSH